MVYVWTAMTDAMGLSYYGIPGASAWPGQHGLSVPRAAQQNAFMRPDKYDQLIEDPNGFLLNVWLPRVSTHLRPAGEPVTEAHNLSLLQQRQVVRLGDRLARRTQVGRNPRQPNVQQEAVGVFDQLIVLVGPHEGVLLGGSRY